MKIKTILVTACRVIAIILAIACAILAAKSFFAGSDDFVILSIGAILFAYVAYDIKDGLRSFVVNGYRVCAIATIILAARSLFGDSDGFIIYLGCTALFAFQAYRIKHGGNVTS